MKGITLFAECRCCAHVLLLAFGLGAGGCSSAAERALDAGNAKWKLGDFDGALSEYEKAIRLDPQFANGYQGRARVLWKKGNLKDALADATRAVELNPNEPSPYKSRGFIYHELDELDKALSDYDRALELAPTDSDALVLRARILLSKKDSTRAMVDTTRALELDPNLVDAYYVRGILRSDSNDHEGAVKDFTRTIDLDPTHAAAYERRGYERLEQEDLPHALADFSKAIEMGKGDDRTFYNRGLVRQKQEDYQGAREDYTEAIKLNPKDPDHYVARATVVLSEGNLSKEPTLLSQMFDDSNKAIELNARNAQSYTLRGIARTLKMELKEAVRDCDRAVELDPKSSFGVLAVAVRTIALALQGQPARSGDALEKAIQGLPQELRPCFHRFKDQLVQMLPQAREIVPEGVLSEMKRSAGSLDGAISELNKNLAIKSGNAVLLTARGMALSEKGKLHEAIADFTAAIASDPTGVRAYVERAQILTTLEDVPAARRDWDHAIRLGTRAARAYSSRGWSRINDSDLNGAISDFQKALELGKQDPVEQAYALKGLGGAHLAMCEYEAADKDYTKALDLEPIDVWTLTWRGMARLRQRDVRGGLEDSDRAHRINPGDLNALAIRGAARKSTGDPKGAIEDYEEVLKRAPRDWTWRLMAETSLREWRRMTEPRSSPLEEISRSLRRLGSEELWERRQAARELARKGSEALPALRKALATASGEPARAMASVVARLEASLKEIAARVNGEVLTWGQVREEFRELKPADLTQGLLEEMRRQLVEEMLIWQMADRKCIEIPEAELQEAFQRDATRYGSQEDFEKVVRIRFGTLARYREHQLQDLTLLKLYRLISGALVPEPEFADLMVTQWVPVEEIRKYFDSHLDQFQAFERISFMRIGLTFSSAEEEAQKLELAESLLRKMGKGAEFAMLAFFYSDVRRAKDFRDLNVARKDLEGVYSAETIGYLFGEMKEGTISPIVKDGRTLNLFKMEQKLSHQAETFEEAEVKIRSILENRKREEIQRKIMDRLKRGAQIEPADVFEEKK